MARAPYLYSAAVSARPIALRSASDRNAPRVARSSALASGSTSDPSFGLTVAAKDTARRTGTAATDWLPRTVGTELVGCASDGVAVKARNETADKASKRVWDIGGRSF